jgi:3D (Asp-Asp-Asp) domain-containing protein
MNRAWILLAVVMALVPQMAKLGHCGEVWRITAYCSCVKCCGKSDGITASGHKLKPGDKVVACNWLPFGTKVEIKGMGVYSVQDRGARSLFGSKKNHIKHLDVWIASHKEALRFGNQYRGVVMIK